MKLVYIAHPFTSYGSTEENRRLVDDICKQIVADHPDVVPVSPVNAFAFLDPTGDQTATLNMCRELLGKCDEIWMYGEWWNSVGCLDERMFALGNGIKVVVK